MCRGARRGPEGRALLFHLDSTIQYNHNIMWTPYIIKNFLVAIVKKELRKSWNYFDSVRYLTQYTWNITWACHQYIRLSTRSFTFFFAQPLKSIWCRHKLARCRCSRATCTSGWHMGQHSSGATVTTSPGGEVWPGACAAPDGENGWGHGPEGSRGWRGLKSASCDVICSPSSQGGGSNLISVE